jgi:hypothetical protein
VVFEKGFLVRFLVFGAVACIFSLIFLFLFNGIFLVSIMAKRNALDHQIFLFIFLVRVRFVFFISQLFLLQLNIFFHLLKFQIFLAFLDLFFLNLLLMLA